MLETVRCWPREVDPKQQIGRSEKLQIEPKFLRIEPKLMNRPNLYETETFLRINPNPKYPKSKSKIHTSMSAAADSDGPPPTCTDTALSVESPLPHLFFANKRGMEAPRCSAN
jgi:hypothetical protein